MRPLAARIGWWFGGATSQLGWAMWVVGMGFFWLFAPMADLDATARGAWTEAGPGRMAPWVLAIGLLPLVGLGLGLRGVARGRVMAALAEDGRSARGVVEARRWTGWSDRGLRGTSVGEVALTVRWVDGAARRATWVGPDPGLEEGAEVALIVSPDGRHAAPASAVTEPPGGIGAVLLPALGLLHLPPLLLVLAGLLRRFVG